MTGCFISFEGPEGCGKTTQIARLEERLRAAGVKTLATREPGGTAISEAIRGVLLDPAHGAMAPLTELMLYAAARAQHVEECIRPAMEAGMVVLSDRYADSTTVYQGHARGLDMDAIETLHGLATRGVWPALTVLLDLPPEAGLARARARGRADRMEQEPLAFHERVRAGFLELAARAPERIKITDAARDPDTVEAQVWALARPLLEPRMAAGAP